MFPRRGRDPQGRRFRILSLSPSRNRRHRNLQQHRVIVLQPYDPNYPVIKLKEPVLKLKQCPVPKPFTLCLKRLSEATIARWTKKEKKSPQVSSSSSDTSSTSLSISSSVSSPSSPSPPLSDCDYTEVEASRPTIDLVVASPPPPQLSPAVLVSPPKLISSQQSPPTSSFSPNPYLLFANYRFVSPPVSSRVTSADSTYFLHMGRYAFE